MQEATAIWIIISSLHKRVTPDGKPLMPTSSYRARRLIKSGKAVIYEHRPFTVMLTRVVSEETQPIEYCCDTGRQHISRSALNRKEAGVIPPTNKFVGLLVPLSNESKANTAVY